MVVASTVVTLNAVNIHVGNLVAVSTVGNLRAVNVLAGNLVAANTPVESMVAASTANAAVMVSIATERKRQRQAQQLSGAISGELLPRAGAFNADFKDLARPLAERLGDGGTGADPPKACQMEACLGYRN